MKLTDIVDAARDQSPNLELVVPTNGGDKDVVLRNMVAMPREDRKALYTIAQEINKEQDENEDGEEDQGDVFSQIADKAKAFLQQVAKSQDQYDALANALADDPDVEDIAWISVFNEYTEATQLGEAITSQDS